MLQNDICGLFQKEIKMTKTLFERQGGSAKIEVPGLKTKWALFRGFSLLFDNPDLELSKGKDQLLDSNVDMFASLEFYRRLRDALHDLDINWLVNVTSFCPLPPCTYHITVWDGLNDGNADQFHAEQYDELHNFFDRLPDGLREDKFADPARNSALLAMEDLSITFRFSTLENWDNVGILCKPDIIDDDIDVYNKIVTERKLLADLYRERFGISIYQEWFPHITLGYFADQEAGSKTLKHIGSWSDRFKEKMDGLTITYKQIGLYGFTDMATFVKCL
jgi:hypothetical protein